MNKVLCSAGVSCLTFVRPKFGMQTLNLLPVMLYAPMTFMTMMTLLQHLARAEKQKTNCGHIILKYQEKDK